MEILTRRGGVFWGLVLVLVGGVWFTAVVLNIPLRFDILIPLLVIIAGIYLLITKLMA